MVAHASFSTLSMKEREPPRKGSGNQMVKNVKF